MHTQNMEYLHARVCYQNVMMIAAPIPTTTVVLLSCTIEVRNEATGLRDDQVALLGWLAKTCWASFTKLCVNVCSFCIT